MEQTQVVTLDPNVANAFDTLSTTSAQAPLALLQHNEVQRKAGVVLEALRKGRVAELVVEAYEAKKKESDEKK